LPEHLQRTGMLHSDEKNIMLFMTGFLLPNMIALLRDNNRAASNANAV